jgi:hypothetical protein
MSSVPKLSGAFSTDRVFIAMVLGLLRYIHKSADSKKAKGSAFRCGHSNSNGRGKLGGKTKSVG